MLEVHTIKKNQGFTLVETLVGIMLTAFVSSALLLGITQVKLSLNAIDARNIAFEELKARTEALLAMAAKDINRPGCISDQDVTLISSASSLTPLAASSSAVSPTRLSHSLAPFNPLISPFTPSITN